MKFSKVPHGTIQFLVFAFPCALAQYAESIEKISQKEAFLVCITVLALYFSNGILEWFSDKKFLIDRKAETTRVSVLGVIIYLIIVISLTSTMVLAFLGGHDLEN